MPRPDEALRKEVFAWYGGAAYSAGLVEAEMIILLLLFDKLRGGESAISPEAYEDLDRQLSKKTLGSLLREFRKHVDIAPEFDDLLNDYLATRNHLIHGFWPSHGESLLSRKGCDAMISELQHISTKMSEANRIIEAISDKVFRRLGFNREQLVSLYQSRWMPCNQRH